MTPLELTLPPGTLEAIAERAAELVAERLPTPTVASPYLDAGEAASYIRASSKQRIYDLKSEGRLPACKDGSRLLFRREDLDAYLEGA